MTRVYVCDVGARVTVRDGALTVLVEGNTRSSCPIEVVEHVCCFGPVQLTGIALQQMMALGIRLDLFTISGRYRGSIHNGRGPSLFVRMAQYDRWRNGEIRLEIARSLLRTKIATQRALAQDWAVQFKVELNKVILRTLEDALRQLETASRIPEMMAIEGRASAAWFQAFAANLPKEMPFNGRSRRPPLDAPNALLSLGYTLLGAEIAGLLEAEGLDPGLAFLHGFRYGRLSLAYDVIEEVRQTVIDRWVLLLVQRRHVLPEHFEARDGGVFLSRTAFPTVLKYYQHHLGKFGDASAWRGRIEKRIRQVRDVILDGGRLEAPSW